MFYIYANGKMIYHLANPELYLVQPKLTLEMGKAGSLEFGIMPDHAYYNRLSQLSTIVTVEYDDVEIFRGRVLSNKRNFQNMREVYCEGNLSYLVDTVQKFKKYNGTVKSFFKEVIANHNTRIKDEEKKFTVGNITVENRTLKLVGQDDNPNEGKIDYKQIALNSITDEWNTTFDLIQTCIIDYVGGYLSTRRQNGVTYIDLLAAPSDLEGNTTTQEIELGVNMMDFEEEISAEDLFTVLIPLGDDNLTIKSVNNGSDELVDANAVAQYGRIIKTHVFSNVNEASTLLENGRRYLASNANIPTTLTVNALDMHIINPEYEAIHLCDKVHIKSTVHALVEYLTCTKIEYDLENPSNDKYTFGNPTQTLTQRYREDKRKESDTYGNSGFGGGGGAAADAAEAASDVQEEEVEKSLKDLYDHYIDIHEDVDPHDGTISLGATYKAIKDLRKVLGGWGIDAFAGEDSHGNVMGSINLNTFYTDTLSGLSSNSTRIEQVSNATESRIDSVVEGFDGRISQISQTVDEHGSAIELKADTVTVNAIKTRIDNLEAINITTKNLSSQISMIERISALSGIVSGEWSAQKLVGTSIAFTDGTPVYGENHVHTVTESNGVVTIGTANIKSTGNSFNIADTNFYKDGVSAAKTEGAQSATLRSLGIDSVGSPYTSDGKKYIDATIAWSVQATKGDGTLYTTSDTIVKAVNATEAYNAGINMFEQVSVSIPTYKGEYWYSEGSSYSYSGTNRGNKYPNELYTPEGSGYRKVTVPLYYSGTSYSYSGTKQGTKNYINVVTGSTSETYYKKKKES